MKSTSEYRFQRISAKVRRLTAALEQQTAEADTLRDENLRLMHALQKAGYEVRRTKKGLRVA